MVEIAPPPHPVGMMHAFTARSLLVAAGGGHVILVTMALWFSVSQPWLRSGLMLSVALLIPAIWGVARGIHVLEASQMSTSTDLANLADFATDLYWETDLDGKITGAGGRMMSVFSNHPREMIGKHYLDIVQLDDAESFKMLTALQGQQPYSDIQSIFHDTKGRRYFMSLSATPQFDVDNQIRGYIGIGTNVTDRVRGQKRMRHLAEHDTLTGIANRYAFMNRIAKDLKACTEDQPLALLAVDLDGFKTINDTYGHQAGDALLKMVAKRLSTKTRETDWAARLGGDEFVLVSRFLSNPMDACLVGERLTHVLSLPYKIGGIKLVVKASIGIACAPDHAATIEQLMKRADIALYRAKSDGKGCYRLYSETDEQPVAAA